MPAVLVVAHNNLHLTKAAVRTALAQTVPCRVLVVNNGCSDGTAAWLRSKPDANLTYWTNLTQKSLSHCWNMGMRVFNRLDEDRVLVVNNDVELRPDTWEVLNWCSTLCGSWFTTGVSMDDRDRVGVPGDRDIQTLVAQARPHPDFSCFLMHYAVMDKIGGFDEDYYPAYVEDSDYHLRMHRAGIKAVCVDLPFYHVRSQTIKHADPGEATRIMREAEENRKRFCKKYGCMPNSPEYYQLFA